MRRPKAGYRVSVYWEEFGTTAEGSMEGERTVVVARRPSGREMAFIERGLKRILEGLGLRKERRVRET